MDLIDVVVIDKGKLPLLTSWGLQNADERNVSKDNREKERGKEGADGRLHCCTRVQDQSAPAVHREHKEQKEGSMK